MPFVAWFLLAPTLCVPVSLAAMLQFMLEESGVMTECELSTVDATDELDFPSAFRYAMLHRMRCVGTFSS